jgi:hypothetical protein
MAGSGFEDVLIESDICVSGSINQMMNGKHYNRAYRVHHLIQDAIHRMLMNSFMENSTWDVNDIKELTLFQCTCSKTYP